MEICTNNKTVALPLDTYDALGRRRVTTVRAANNRYRDNTMRTTILKRGVRWPRLETAKILLLSFVTGAMNICVGIPLLLAASLAVSLPLLNRLEGKAYLAAISVLDVVAILVVHIAVLLLLLVWLKRHAMLLSLSSAVFLNAFLVSLKFRMNLHISLLTELVVEVVMVFLASLAIALLWRKFKGSEAF